MWNRSCCHDGLVSELLQRGMRKEQQIHAEPLKFKPTHKIAAALQWTAFVRVSTQNPAS